MLSIINGLLVFDIFRNTIIIHGTINQIVFEYFDLYLFLLFKTITSDMKTAQSII